MSGTEKRILHYVSYLREPSMEVETYKGYDFLGTGAHTIPQNGEFVKPGRYTAMWAAAHTPLENVIGSHRWYTVPAVPYATENCWGYISKNNLQIKALSRFGERKMSLGETLAESKQSFNMIAKNLTAVGSMLMYLRRGNMRAAANAVGLGGPRRNYSRDASSKYLELIFGWQPLIGEVYNGVDVIQNGLNRHERHAFVTCTARKSHTFSRETGAVYGTPPGEIVTTGKGLVSYTFLFTHQSYGRTLNQLGLSSPYELAWNLLPYSFLVDWAIPISSWLGAFYATQGLTFQDAFNTSYTNHMFVTDANYSAKYPNSARIEAGLVQRRLITDGSVPLPEFELDPSIFKAITAAALLLQRSR